MRKFEIGDKIKFVDISNVSNFVNTVDIYTIENFNGNKTGVYLKEHPSIGWFNIDWIVLVDKATKTYTLEEVFTAYSKLYNIPHNDFNLRRTIELVQEELDKLSNPGYIKYSELKEKFENED